MRGVPRVWPRLTSSIAVRLVAGFLLIALLPAGALVAIGYTMTESAMTRAVQANLAALADARASQIDGFLQERQRAVGVLARQPEAARAVEDFTDAYGALGDIQSPEYRRTDQRHRTALTRLVDVGGFADLFLVSDAGEIMFSVRRGVELGTSLVNGPFHTTELARVFDRARTLLGTELSDFALYPPSGEQAAFVAAPVVYNGVVTGVMALQMTNTDFQRLVADTTGLGRTGETMVAATTAHGSMALAVAPLRHDPDAAFRRSVPFDSPAGQPLEQALRGVRGHGLVPDYRGVPSVAAWRHLPALGAGMMVKIDAAEALAPVREQLNVLLAVGGVILALAVVTSLVLARTIANPLRRLTAAARAVAAGDLNQTVAATSRDELGVFTTTFNQMMADLRRTYETIEETVKLRTDQLRQETETVRTLNSRMMDSLGYASRIQRSLLPPAEALGDRMLELAVHWEPRDVVGGDIYWWHATEDGCVVVLADCTGHGVPGAFMTIIVANALDRLRRDGRLNDPAEVLVGLDRLVKRALQQAGGDSLADDGLDAAVCHLSYSAGTLSFAGARLPVMVETGGEFLEYRGDRKSVGYRSLDIGDGFTTHTLNLTDDMAVWLLTDGVTDQLGDRRRVAFGRRRVKAALEQAGGSVTERAAAVLRALDDHQGASPRLDDLTLIGFRPRTAHVREAATDAGIIVKEVAESC